MPKEDQHVNRSLLLKAIKKYPEIWDSNNKLHMCRSVTAPMWQEIAEQFGGQVPTVKLQSIWSQMKYHYHNLVHRQILHKERFSTKWEHFNTMSFMYNLTVAKIVGANGAGSLVTTVQQPEKHFAETRSVLPSSLSITAVPSHGLNIDDVSAIWLQSSSSSLMMTPLPPPLLPPRDPPLPLQARSTKSRCQIGIRTNATATATLGQSVNIPRSITVQQNIVVVDGVAATTSLSSTSSSSSSSSSPSSSSSNNIGQILQMPRRRQISNRTYMDRGRSSAAVMNSDTRSRIIEAIRRRPMLWIGRKGINRGQNRTLLAWKEVAVEMELAPNIIQTRWSIIKQRYVDELQKERNAHYANIPFRSTWEHFESMEFMRDYLEKKVDEREITREQIRKIVNEKQEMENNYQEMQQQQVILDVDHDDQTVVSDRVSNHFQHHEQLQLHLQQQQHMQELLQEGVTIEEETQTDQNSELIDNHHNIRGVESIYLTRSKQQLEDNLLISTAASEPLHIHTKDYYHEHCEHSQLEIHHPSMVEVTIDESPMAIATSQEILSPTEIAEPEPITPTITTLPVVPTTLYRNQNAKAVPALMTGSVSHQIRTVINRRRSHPEITTPTDDLEWNPFEMIMQVHTNGENNDEGVVVVGEQEVNVGSNDGIAIGPKI